RWYDPRNGGALQGTSTISGSSNFVIPASPNAGNSDWIVMLQSTSISLPVELGYFEGERLNANEVQLRWQSLQEINTLRFEIESSPDGQASQYERSVDAAGNSNTPISYQSVIPSENAFFRLKMVDLDGSFQYSNWLNIEDIADAVLVAPNPFNEELRLIVPESLIGAEIQIYDLVGRECVPAQMIEQLETIIPPAGMQNGIYLLRISRGREVLYQRKLVKQ
ncbi:MAG: T9SS type A sorting domain-containing protein, partial [Bacteroidota bacterium]